MAATLNTLSTDVAIIGAGPAGLFMAFEAGFLGYKSVIIDALPQAGGQLAALYPEKPIYDIPGHPHILAGDLVKNLMTQAAQFNPGYVLGEQVVELVGEAGAFTLTTTSQTIHAKVVVLAGGGGMFAPRKPTQLNNLAEFEGASVFYAVTNKAAFAGQNVVIAGGGDSAVDWVNELASMAAHVHVVHRRADFRAVDASLATMYGHIAAGRVSLHTPYQLHALHGANGVLEAVEIADLDEQPQTLQATRLVCCFGLLPTAGVIAGWGLGIAKGQVPVNQTTLQTCKAGVLCVGDMASYEGKVALILTGFAEAATAAKTIQSIIDPHKKYRVQYSTSTMGKDATG